MNTNFVEERVPIGICQDDFEGSIDTVIVELKNLQIAAVEKGYRNISIKIDTGYEGASFDLIGERPLTEKEITSRKKKAEAQRKATKAAKEKRMAREKAEWERLSGKFAATGE